jgi:hypothetical protein
MDLVVGAVLEHDLSLISTDQALLQKAEEPCERESVEVLAVGRLFNEFIGQNPSRGTFEHQIPKGAEVLIHGGLSTARRYNVVASNVELPDIIFEAARGAEPAQSGGGQS